MRHLIAAAFVLTLLIPLRFSAQTPLPAFEVASVKPNKTAEDRFTMGFQRGGQFTAINVPLKLLIAQAYGTPPPLPLVRILGGPDWTNSDRFDIIAKAEGDPPRGQDGPMVLMLRSLLKERFKLVAHIETRQLDVYELVFARSDRQLGPQLRPASVDCDALRAANRGRGSGSGVPPPPPVRGQRPICSAGGSPGHFAGGGVTMTQLANALGGRVGRPVVDSTGLSGGFDLDLSYKPDQMPQEPLPPEAPPIDPSGPSIFTAMEEQLGLKLVSSKGSTDVLVIDSVERPTPD